MTRATNVHATGLVLGGAGRDAARALGRGQVAAGARAARRLGGARAERRCSSPTTASIWRREAAALMMQAPAAIAGLIELRGRGIVSRPHRRARRRSHLVVDLVPRAERMLEEDAWSTEMLGRHAGPLPGADRPASIDARHQLLLVREALARARPDEPQPVTKNHLNRGWPQGQNSAALPRPGIWPLGMLHDRSGSGDARRARR